MRVTALLLMVPLLLGGVTTIAVAWAIAAWQSIPMYPRDVGGAFIQWEKVWHIAETRTWGATDVWWNETKGDIVDEPSASEGILGRLAAMTRASQHTPEEILEQMHVWHARLDAERDWFTVRNSPLPWGTFAQQEPPARTAGACTAFGWPRRCLWYQVTGRLVRGTITGGADTILGDELHGGWHLRGAVSSRLRNFHALPYRPIWSGLIINSTFYTSSWLVLLAGPYFARRWIRQRRGCCADCGYDLSGSTMPGCPECGRGRGDA